MKFSLISALVIGLATFVLAEDEPHYFFFPADGSEFAGDDQITFATNGITNDADETIIAKLFNAEDDSEVKQIGSYTGDSIVRPDDNDEWTFTWVIDVDPGTYYVRLYEQDADGQIDDDDEWDNEIISYDFRVRGSSSKRKRAALKRSQNMKKRSQAFRKVVGSVFLKNITVVFAVTQCASRQAGVVCAAILIICGIFGKISAALLSIPAPLIGGMIVYLFASVATSGIRILGHLDWSRRNRVIVASSIAISLGVSLVPTWFDNVLPTFENEALQSLMKDGNIVLAIQMI